MSDPNPSTPRAAPPDNPNRLKDFKNIGLPDSEELRRRRCETKVELRKAKKDEQLTKRRNLNFNGIGDDPSQAENGEEQETNVEFKLDDVDDNVGDGGSSGIELKAVAQLTESLEDIFIGMMSDDPTIQFAATTKARKLVSQSSNPPIQETIKAGIIQRAVEFLFRTDNPDLQFEAAWFLTNISSGTSEQTHAVVNAGAVGPFIEMLKSPHCHIAEQALWGLANILGDGPILRDFVVSQGFMEPFFCSLRTNGEAISFIRNAAWTLSNLVRWNKPPLPEDLIQNCLPIAITMIQDSSDMEVISNALWILAYISSVSKDRDSKMIDLIIGFGILRRIMELLGCSDISLLLPALRAIGNIITGNHEQTQAVLDAGFIHHLYRFLCFENKNIVKEAAWAASNIAAGTKEQIQMLLDSGIIRRLFIVLQTGDYRSQKEVIWAIYNISSGGTIEQAMELLDDNVITRLCGMLRMNNCEASEICVVLDTLKNLLKAAVSRRTASRFTSEIEECGGLEKIEELQSHENLSIYEKSYGIIEEYFTNLEDDEQQSAVFAELQATLTIEPASDNNNGLENQVNEQQPPQPFNF